MKGSIKVLLNKYQVRKTKQQKKEFRSWLEDYLITLGFKPDYQIYKKNEAGVNIIIGDVKKAKIILSAHYDTPSEFFFPVYVFVSNWIVYIVNELLLVIPGLLMAVFVSVLVEVITNTPMLASLSFNTALIILSIYELFEVASKHTAKDTTSVNDTTSGVAALLSIMEELPQDERENVAFVFFDQEKLGLLGSRAFKKKYRKEVESKPLINFDCVSDGSNVFFISNWNFSHSNEYKALRSTLDNNTSNTQKKVTIVPSPKLKYPYDQVRFENSVGVTVLKKVAVLGYSPDRVHTFRNIKFDIENLTIFTAIVIDFVINSKNVK